jgi:hypothetical protein
MPMELNMQALGDDERQVCENTISPNTFFMLVADALVSNRPLSVVRMGDGERMLYIHCRDSGGNIRPPNSPLDETWLKEFGCWDIPTSVLSNRIRVAAEESTYFAPQIMGIQRSEFAVAKLFAKRERYVDNWFVRTWSRKLQDQLLITAGRVVFIHGKTEVRESFSARVESLAVDVETVAMQDWREADNAIERSLASKAQLILFSGGPANKFIAPILSKQGKVVIDLGQAAAKEWL